MLFQIITENIRKKMAEINTWVRLYRVCQEKVERIQYTDY